jgi:hypothetical protein
MEEFGIKCMEKMQKKLDKKRDGDQGEFASTAVTYPKKVTFEGERPGTTMNSGKHVANMHIDVVPDAMKAKRLKGAIKLCTDKVLESRAVTPWRYTGSKVCHFKYRTLWRILSTRSIYRDLIREIRRRRMAVMRRKKMKNPRPTSI